MTEQKPRILVIDDTPANVQVLIAALDADFDLRIARSGTMGLMVAQKTPPDLILLDVMMPEMDGFEVCRQLKAHPQLRAIPVVFVTAVDESEAESFGLALGAADFITKPISVDIARQRICNLLDRERLRKEVEASRDHLEELVLARTMALSIAKEAAEVAHCTKTRFLNNMTHELRTPMNAIMGLTALALGRATDPKQADQLNKAQQACEQLLTLITLMMDLTALESRQLALENSTFTLGAVLERLSGLLAPDARKKGLELSVNTDPRLTDLPLRGDAMRVGQILLAMTGNAIKFTAQGRVAVAALLTEQTAEDIEVRFEVSDTGVGVAAADQKRIFEVFEQADDSSKRRYGGAGLGLALSRQLIELMGGAYGLRSELGAGSVFWFTLPLRQQRGQTSS